MKRCVWLHSSAAASAAPDFIHSLLQTGRAADTHMKNYFLNAKQYAAASESLSSSESSSSSAATASPLWRRAALTRAAAASALAGGQEKQPSWRALAYSPAEGSPASWYVASYPSLATVRAEADGGDEDGRVALHGHAIVCGDPQLPPTHAVVLARDASTGVGRRFVVALDAPEAALRRRALLPGVERLVLSGATATAMATAAGTPEAFACEQYVLRAAAFSGLLKETERVCALHLAEQAQYDGLLLRNPAMQARLAQLSTWRFGLESLLQFVADHVSTAADAPPLRESCVMNLFAQMALESGRQLAAEILHGRRHASPSPPGCPVTDLLTAPSLSWAAPCGSFSMQVRQILLPAWKGGEVAGAAPSHSGGATWLSSVMGLHSGGGVVRLSTTHANLQLAVRGIERDISTCLTLLKTADPLSSAVHIFAGKMLAELFASVAVLHRGSAALSLQKETGTAQQPPTEAAAGGDEGLMLHTPMPPHREALLVDAFHLFSAQRREACVEALRRTKTMNAVVNHTSAASPTIAFLANPVSTEKEKGTRKGAAPTRLEDCVTHPVDAAAMG